MRVTDPRQSVIVPKVSNTTAFTSCNASFGAMNSYSVL